MLSSERYPVRPILVRRGIGDVQRWGTALTTIDESLRSWPAWRGAAIDGLPAKVTGKQLDKGRLLTVHLTVSEPATITLEILKKGKIPRQVTVTRTSAGSFAGQIALKHISGKLTLRATATDMDGASAVVEQQFKAR